jgi:hypothetical protein
MSPNIFVRKEKRRRALVEEARCPLGQELADGGILAKTDGAAIGGKRLFDALQTRQQMSGKSPVGLIVVDSAFRDGLEQRPSRLGIAGFGDGRRAADQRAEGRGEASEPLIEQSERFPVGVAGPDWIAASNWNRPMRFAS